MGRIRIIFVSTALLLSGCAAVATVAAIPGALIEGTVNYLQSQEESLPVNMQTALAAVQQGLRRMDLAVDVLEPVKEGYAIGFGNEELDGTIEVKKQTTMLTTVAIIAQRGVSREKSVEQAIIKVIRDVSEQRKNMNFDFKGYRHIRILPSINAQRIGWYRPGASLKINQTRKNDWLRIKMPSGKWGYLQGRWPK